MKIKVIERKKNPIIEPGIKGLKLFGWDALWAYHPCIINFRKEYYLFYTGKSVGREINHRIGVAVSNNLKTWEKVSANPVLKEGKRREWDSDFTAHAFVFREGAKFYMLYDGSKRGNWHEEIGLAESNNLLDWKKYPNNPIFKTGKNWWEKRHVSRCCVIKEKGIYYLYYAGHDGERERIGVAKGKNLFKLERCLGKPILDVGGKGDWDEGSISDPRVIRYKGGYLMFYSGTDGKGIERTGLAISTNLLSWRKYEKDPVLNVSSNNWDKISAARADVKIINNQIYLFYSGKKKFFYHIGMAKLKIT